MLKRAARYFEQYRRKPILRGYIIQIKHEKSCGTSDSGSLEAETARQAEERHSMVKGADMEKIWKDGNLDKTMLIMISSL